MHYLIIDLLFCLPLSASAQEWTRQDSIRLQKILQREGEIRLNPEAVQELKRSFNEEVPRAYSNKPWLDFQLALPGEKRSGKNLFSSPLPERYNQAMHFTLPLEANGLKPSGLDLMLPFTKEFWTFRKNLRRARTLEVLRSYADSTQTALLFPSSDRENEVKE
ncbi:MAG: DUF4858 domain-containing protein [Bacteroides sp.]|nr:DUF4858 domain-containing protein [Bacteroides sp.]